MVCNVFPSVLVFDNMNEEETADTLVIVFIAETDPDAVFQVSVSVVVVYHVAIVAIGNGLLKKFWPMVIGCVLRTAWSSII